MAEREKFEKFATEHLIHFSASLEKHKDIGEYLEGAMVACYLTWQAATKAAVPQWIPVSERLPEDGANVLIFDKFGTHGSIYTLNYYDGFMLKHKGVTHWMPLPSTEAIEKGGDK